MSFINIWAILIAMVVSVGLGFIWYGPLFGKPWMRLSGIKMPETKPGMGTMVKPMILSFIGAALMTWVLSFSIAFHDAYYLTSGMTSALSIAFLLWLGFIVPAYLNLLGWEGKSFKLFCINTGYWLVYLLIVAGVITILA